MSSEPTKEDSEADKDKRLCKLITSLTTAHLVRHTSLVISEHPD